MQNFFLSLYVSNCKNAFLDNSLPRYDDDDHHISAPADRALLIKKLCKIYKTNL
jgi:hypothetical protein